MTEPIKLTFDEARELIDRAIAEKGEDHVYTDETGHKGGELGVQCRNFHSNGQPGCIVGHALSYLGFKVGDFDEEGIETLVYENSDRLDVDGDALRFLEVIQGYQDNGEPWGEARKRTLAELEVSA